MLDLKFSESHAVRDAIADPESVVGPRYSGPGWVEDMANWQARAAIAVLLAIVRNKQRALRRKPTLSQRIKHWLFCKECGRLRGTNWNCDTCWRWSGDDQDRRK